MSNSDIKYNLRKFDFPLSAKEGLLRIDQLLVGRNAPSNKQIDLAMDIITEFIFCEMDRRNVRRISGLNSIQELQLIDVICDFFSGDFNETSKNTIFLSLFGGIDSQKRMNILCKLASMAVSALNTPILLAIGTWLQQTGCSSPQSLQLAENLIRDHFKLQASNEESLKSLANVAPQFVANFITAVTELYLHENGNEELTRPPLNLLEIITFWVCSNPKLCMSAQLNPASLPNGSIPMAAVTPLAGLMQWCALAPLTIKCEAEDANSVDTTILPIKKLKLESDIESTKQQQVSPVQETSPIDEHLELELYRRLHVGVLHSLCEGKRPHGPPTAVNAQHLAIIVNPVHHWAAKLLSEGLKLNMHPQLQECLDRIGQATQVALANGCVYGNISNLLVSLDALPENRLLRIVIKTHQQNIIC